MISDSIENGTPASEAEPKAKRGPAKKAKPAKKADRTKKAGGKPKVARASKKAEVITLMKRAKGDEGHRLAAAHGARLRQYPGQQGRREDRIVQERGRRADVQDQVARAHIPSNAAPVPTRAAFLLV